MIQRAPKSCPRCGLTRACFKIVFQLKFTVGETSHKSSQRVQIRPL